jgi:inorganic triphosphatase YgiF
VDERNGIESERKFDVRPDVPAPPLGALPGVLRVGGAAEHHLEAIYFDTVDLALAAHGITLRRRTGGHDAGWHLKLPLGPDWSAS